MPSTSIKHGAAFHDVVTPENSADPIEDPVRFMQRRLVGVSRDQLIDERQSYEKRKANIEARARLR